MSQLAFKRYIWLIDTISQAGEEGIPFEKIREKWSDNHLSDGKPYALRTFHNHRKDIMDIFNIHIRCKKSTNSYYIAGDRQSNQLLKKMMELAMLNQLIGEYPLTEGKIYTDLKGGDGSYLPQLAEAIGKNRKIDLLCNLAGTSTETTYSGFTPLALKLVQDHWFLLGKDAENQYHLIEFKHIKKITLLSELFESPDKILLKELLVENYGAALEAIETEEVMLKFSKDSAVALLENPLHPSQQEIERRKNYSVFYYFLKPTQAFVRQLLSYGDTVEVLAPVTLRQALSQMAKKIAKRNQLSENNEIQVSM